MRIGIVTDIHDEVELLAQALAAIRTAGVDAIVSLGDTSDLYGRWQKLASVATLLKDHGVVGVWGNHDFGLCRTVADEARQKFPAEALDFMATFQPRLELGNCHFSHVEPFLNPEKPEDLWCIEDCPDDRDRIAQRFAAIPHRAAFIGHFHCWRALSEDGRIEWNGTTSLHFEAGKRYLVVVGPLFRGDFAIIDTDRWVLEPHRLPQPATGGYSS